MLRYGTLLLTLLYAFSFPLSEDFLCLSQYMSGMFWHEDKNNITMNPEEPSLKYRTFHARAVYATTYFLLYFRSLRTAVAYRVTYS